MSAVADCLGALDPAARYAQATSGVPQKSPVSSDGREFLDNLSCSLWQADAWHYSLVMNSSKLSSTLLKPVRRQRRPYGHPQHGWGTMMLPLSHPAGVSCADFQNSGSGALAHPE